MAARSGIELTFEAIGALLAVLITYKSLSPQTRPAFLRILKWMLVAFLAFAALILVLGVVRTFLHGE